LFCEKCVKLVKAFANFKKTSLQSESYLKSFVAKINQDFQKSLPPTGSSSRNEIEDVEEEDPDLDQLLLSDSENQHPDTSEYSSQEFLSDHQVGRPRIPKPSPMKVNTPEKIPLTVKKLDKKPQIKIERVGKSSAISRLMQETAEESKEYSMDVDSSALYEEDEEEQLDDDGHIFGEEIYDIMEIENEGADNIYLDESGKQVGEDESEFILVNFKSSNEDLEDKDQFVVEELYDEEPSEAKPVQQRKKHVNRMPREIIDKYAQSTENNQHICTKCVKVFSTRTNLIRHIQSHDGYKAYVCQVCNKGFTQSGSLKQHMYIHSGERPYKCQFCDRAFTQGKTLKFHLRRHTEEKPFTCTVCNSSFRQRDGLKRHLKSRHNIELKYDRNNQLMDKAIDYVNVDNETESNTDTKTSESAAEENKKD
jgi:uncharacterized C2H2 Zn-finger protein